MPKRVILSPGLFLSALFAALFAAVSAACAQPPADIPSGSPFGAAGPSVSNVAPPAGAMRTPARPVLRAFAPRPPAEEAWAPPYRPVGSNPAVAADPGRERIEADMSDTGRRATGPIPTPFESGIRRPW